MPEEGRGFARVAKVTALLVVVWIVDMVDNLLAHGVQPTPINLALSFATSVAMAVFLAWLVPLIRLKLASVVMVLWVNLFAVGYMINYIEGAFFTTMYASVTSFGIALLRAAVISSVVTAVAVFLLSERGSTAGLLPKLKEHLATRTRRSWVVRILAGALVYLPIYFFFGLLVTPFVLPYYSNPANGLVIPPFSVIIPVEIFRGFLFVLVLLPLMAALAGSRNLVFVALAAMLYIPGALVPLFGSGSFPLAIAPFHGTEILADSIVYGFALSRIIGVGKS